MRKHFADPADLQQAIDQTRDGLELAKQTVEAAQAERAKLPERSTTSSVSRARGARSRLCSGGGSSRKSSKKNGTRTRSGRSGWRSAAADGKVAHARDQIYNLERAVGAAEARIADAAKARDQAKARAAELHEQIGEQLKSRRSADLPASARRSSKTSWGSSTGISPASLKRLACRSCR